jgi:hypothetical protein
MVDNPLKPIEPDARHTPGPFALDPGIHELLALNTAEAVITAPGTGPGRKKLIAILWKTDDELANFEADPEAVANARLLIAAPELARALWLTWLRLRRKADTCRDADWKAADQKAYEAAAAALKKCGYLK